MKSSLLLSVVIILLAASCKKTEIKDIEKAGAKLIGTWQVSSINIRSTDTMGNSISDSTIIDQGAVAFAHGDKSAIGGGYFDHADFTGPCAASDLVEYFRNKAAGDLIADGWSLSWDADPEDLRVQFWAESAGGSYHRSVNHSLDGNKQQLFYVIQPMYENRRYFYTWKLSK